MTKTKISILIALLGLLILTILFVSGFFKYEPFVFTDYQLKYGIYVTKDKDFSRILVMKNEKGEYETSLLNNDTSVNQLSTDFVQQQTIFKEKQAKDIKNDK